MSLSSMVNVFAESLRPIVVAVGKVFGRYLVFLESMRAGPLILMYLRETRLLSAVLGPSDSAVIC